jgi:hypothetical protein
MLAWAPNRVAIIVGVIVVLALAGTQLPGLVRGLAERHYRRAQPPQTDDGPTDRRDDDDEDLPPMEQSS